MLCVTAAFAIMALLYWLAPPKYFESLLVAWGVIPFRFLFLDTETILSALRCARDGVDVLAANPCDPLQRVFDYSPAWLVLQVFPVTTAWIPRVGLAVDGAFIASLLVLPPARTRRATLLVALGALSTSVAFALERANSDLLVFALVALAASLACRSWPWRQLAYAGLFLAGLLKYYPMITLALATRERPARFAAVAVLSTLALLLFCWLERNDLPRALALIPGGPAFGDMFGAHILTRGLGELWDADPAVARAAASIMTLAALAAAVALGSRDWLAADLDRLTPPERAFLLAGATIVAGFFFTAPNIGYRATLLLIALPALTALWESSRRRLYLWLIVAVLLAMWAEGWRHWLDTTLRGIPPWSGDVRWDISGPRLGAWLLRELCWWWSVTGLAALAIGLLQRSTMARALRLSAG